MGRSLVDSERSESVRRRVYLPDVDEFRSSSGPLSGIVMESLGTVASTRAKPVKEGYVADLTREGGVSPSCIILGLLYIHRLTESNPRYLRTMSGKDLFLTAMVIASKYLNDEGESEALTNSEWAEVGCKAKPSLDLMERQFLAAISLSMYIHLLRVCGLFEKLLESEPPHEVNPIKTTPAQDWRLYVSLEEYYSFVTGIEGRIALKQFAARGWLTYTDMVTVWDTMDTQKALLTATKQVAKVTCGSAAVYLVLLSTLFTASHTLNSSWSPSSPSPSPSPSCATVNNNSSSTDVSLMMESPLVQHSAPDLQLQPHIPPLPPPLAHPPTTHRHNCFSNERPPDMLFSQVTTGAPQTFLGSNGRSKTSRSSSLSSLPFPPSVTASMHFHSPDKAVKLGGCVDYSNPVPGQNGTCFNSGQAHTTRVSISQPGASSITSEESWGTGVVTENVDCSGFGTDFSCNRSDISMTMCSEDESEKFSSCPDMDWSTKSLSALGRVGRAILRYPTFFSCGEFYKQEKLLLDTDTLTPFLSICRFFGGLQEWANTVLQPLLPLDSSSVLGHDHHDSNVTPMAAATATTHCLVWPALVKSPGDDCVQSQHRYGRQRGRGYLEGEQEVNMARLWL